LLNKFDILAWAIAIPSAIFFIWFTEKYESSINLFVDNQARKLECPFVSKLYVWVCCLTSFCTFGLLLYSLLWFLDNGCDIVYVVFWLYVFWVGTDTIRMYSNTGRCKHSKTDVVLWQEQEVSCSAYNYFGDYTAPLSVDALCTKQKISAWCPKCGALRIDDVWTNPKEMKRKYKNVRGVGNDVSEEDGEKDEKA